MAERRILPVASSAFNLDDCMMKSGSIPGVEEWYENQYHIVIGEIEDHDFLLSNSLVVHKGPPDGGYHLAEDGVENTIHFLMLPKLTRGQIMNNDFITGGEAPWENHQGTELKVIREEDRVVWKLAGREFIASPPYFELQGAHKGVELDLKMHSICTGFPYLGQFKDIAQNMSAGIDEYTQAQGTIRVAGKEYEIAHAGGLYEHVALPAWDDVALLLHGGYYWVVGWSEDIQVFLFSMNSIDNFTAHVILDGKPISFHGREQVSIHELENWADPKSKMVTPCKWLIKLISDQGKLDVVVSSGGRSYNINCYRNGYLVRYFNLCTMNGNFTIAGGRRIPIENVRIVVDRSVIINVLQ